MSARILIIEDEPAIRELIQVNLAHAGFEVVSSEYASEGKREIDYRLPDLILLDWMLPDFSGIELAKQLRQDIRTRKLPIIMLTARAEEFDKLAGFDAGADDYITKPFSPRELLARVKALLRRTAPEASGVPITIGRLTLDPQSFRVNAESESVSLSPTEFRLLHYMMSHADKVLSRSKLLDEVWGDHVFIEERTVDVHIRRLRLALQPHGCEHMVETVRGGGYRFAQTLRLADHPAKRCGLACLLESGELGACPSRPGPCPLGVLRHVADSAAALVAGATEQTRSADRAGCLGRHLLAAEPDRAAQ
ncbi:MAG: phosphate regulon transcriptional regulatory protein PhoB [Betaproteobacteria bacterium]|nr:phosphate regulon transcriptional regulatory protein PhoB [Betaproteobacteria bacterium]